MLGMFMTIPLLALSRQRPANLWLGLFLLSISWLSFAELYQYYPQLFGLFDWPLAALGAFYYCYVRSVSGLGVGRREAWHFLPLALLVCFLVWMRLNMPMDGPRGGSSTAIRTAFGVMLFSCQALAFAYAGLVLWTLDRHRRRLRQNYSSTGQRDLRWLTWLTLVIVALLLAWVPATVFGGPWRWPLVIGRLALLYFIGWFGLRQVAVFLPQPAELAPPPAEAAPEPEPELDQAARDKYVRSGMTEAASELIGQRLQRRAAHERDFLDSEITLGQLAERIGTSPHLVSQYLNHVLGLNFFDYINGLRVAEVQTKMRDPARAEATLLDLAHESGFNSKSTFNAAFKRISGVAPSVWRKQQFQTSAPVG